ncbi:MAG: PQQ-binding-like beta-propeller repeat protein, partial [Prolixibacteraceae bacterium]|nr:PQQ-binding-like beta-propeller repeat protein [Prolixibacteraceae bacterium]
MKPKKNKPIRLIPGIIIALLLILIRFVMPVVIPNTTEIGIMLSFLALPAVIIWWVFFSRVPVIERLTAIILMIVTLFISSNLLHESIKTGMQGMMYFLLAPPFLCLAFIVWAVVSRNFKIKIRYLTMILTIIIASGIWTLYRSNGITGEAGVDLVWRWSETAEEKFLEQSGSNYMTVSEPVSTYVEWPGFRGINRDSKIEGIRIGTDWESTPPVELWRKSIGPACSSFSVWGNLIFTQEQHGEDEIVSCYNLQTGEPVWQHSDEARFWDSHAGAGPRGTPTISKGLIYSLGATGILNVLNAVDGDQVWSNNVAEDTKTELPGWGFASSPLV